MEFDQKNEGPLEGVRVLDLTRLVAGNMLSLQLADMGADVIRVDRSAAVTGGDPEQRFPWYQGRSKVSYTAIGGIL